MSLIRNRAQLLVAGLRDLRSVALDVAEAGLAALDPGAAVMRHVTVDAGRLRLAGRSYELPRLRRLFVLGAGKASLRIAESLEALLGERVDGGVVVVPVGQARPLRRCEVLEGDHPVPGERSLEAARRLLGLAGAAGEGDLVLACFTGGSSALASLPPPGMTLAVKAELHRLLLASGADITEINAVRKHVSALKGGRLALAAVPAQVVNLTVSDVHRDPLDCITDPTVQDTSNVADAVAVLHRHGLWERVPPAVRDHLGRPVAAESPRLHPEPPTALLVSGDDACDAMARRAERLGFAPVVLTTALEGESREVGKVLAVLAREAHHRQRPFVPPCVLLGCGGETTVTLASSVFGEGGPNQELAIATAQALRPEDAVAAVYLDTDGHDGGSAAAGAVVDGLTACRAERLGVDLRVALAEHSAGAALDRLGDLVVTGPTGTNVNDLFAIAVGGG